MTAHLCIPRQYDYNGTVFELAGWGQPWPLKLNGDPKKRAGRVFYAKIRPWLTMTKEAQEAYRVGGGCQTIETKETK